MLRMRIMLRAYFGMFVPRRAKELFLMDTTLFRFAIGAATFFRGVTLVSEKPLDLDPAFIASLSQLIALDSLGVLALCLGVLAMFNSFFIIKNRHMVIVEHCGMVLFWASMALYSLYGQPVSINYHMISFITLWTASRMDDE